MPVGMRVDHRSRPSGPGRPSLRVDGLGSVATRSIRAPSVAQALVDPLVAAVDLADVADLATALGAQRGDQHRHAGADVGALDALAVQPARAADDRPVRVAERDPAPIATSLSTKNRRFSNIFSKIRTVPSAWVASARRSRSGRPGRPARGRPRSSGSCRRGRARRRASGRRARARRRRRSRSAGRAAEDQRGSSRRSSGSTSRIRSSPPVTPASAMKLPISMWSGPIVVLGAAELVAAGDGHHVRADPVDVARPSSRAGGRGPGRAARRRRCRSRSSPGVSAAAISAFSVPITDGSSMKISHGAQAADGRVELDVALVPRSSAPSSRKASRCGSRRRRPMTSPPGGGMTARAEAGEQRAGEQERGADRARRGPRSTSACGSTSAAQSATSLSPSQSTRDAEVLEQREHRLDVADPRHVAEDDLLRR